MLIQIYELISKAFAPEEWNEIICSCTRKQKQERKPKKVSIIILALKFISYLVSSVAISYLTTLVFHYLLKFKFVIFFPVESIQGSLEGGLYL